MRSTLVNPCSERSLSTRKSRSASSSRSPDNASAYTGAPRSRQNSRTRSRHDARSPPISTRSKERLIELHVDVQRHAAIPVAGASRCIRAEDRLLLDRLRRAGAAIARRTISRDQHERYTAVKGFDRRREQLRNCSARRRDHGDGSLVSLRAPQRKKRSRSLIDERVRAKRDE